VVDFDVLPRNTHVEADIADRVRKDFSSEDVTDAITMLEESGRSEGRLGRCIVVASEGSLEHLRQHIEMANLDPRDVIVAGEYDPGFRQLRDLRASFLIDAPEKFWIGGVTAALYGRGYVLRSLDSRRATVGPFEYTADEGEGVAEFVGDSVPVTVDKSNRHWTLHGDPEALEAYDLARSFDDESAFTDAISCYILAKQKRAEQGADDQAAAAAK
jgi:hypothetical protein